MSSTIIYGARICRTESTAAVQLKCRDSNVQPYTGRHSDGLSFETVRVLPLEDLEACAVWLEELASNYDSGCVKERPAHADGYRAYELWRGRFEAGTGLRLRGPRWQAIYHTRIPRGVFSGRARVQIARGQAVSSGEVAALIDLQARLPVHVSSLAETALCLGFADRDGRACVFRGGSRRAGLVIPAGAVVTALAAFDSWRHQPWMAEGLALRPSLAERAEDAWAVVFDWERGTRVLTLCDEDICSCDVSSAAWQRVAAFPLSSANQILEALRTLTPGIRAGLAGVNLVGSRWQLAGTEARERRAA